MDYTEEQLRAIELGCNVKEKRLVSVTGEAGTGKTTVIKAIYYSLTNAGYSVALCAPTGKAARRIEQATGIPAKTIHRLLEFSQPGERDERGRVSISGFPKRTSLNRLEYDVIIADEYTMVNHDIHESLMNAMKLQGAFRAFGDINQLKPIEQDKSRLGIPTPFEKLLSKFDSVKLTQIHRQSSESSILVAAQKILKGMPPQKSSKDFNITYTDDPVSYLKYDLLLRQGMDFSSLSSQIITTQSTSFIGTHKLNAVLQQFYHGTSAVWLDLDRHYYDNHPLSVTIGDKIVYTANVYATQDNDLEIMNGEIGIIVDIDLDSGVVVDFGDRIVTIPTSIAVPSDEGKKWIDPRKNIQLAYVLTTHKCQGSEFDNVAYVMNRSTFYGQSRRNFYTAVTRGRNYVEVITDMASLSRSLNNRG